MVTFIKFAYTWTYTQKHSLQLTEQEGRSLPSEAFWKMQAYFAHWLETEHFNLGW